MWLICEGRHTAPPENIGRPISRGVQARCTLLPYPANKSPNAVVSLLASPAGLNIPWSRKLQAFGRGHQPQFVPALGFSRQHKRMKERLYPHGI